MTACDHCGRSDGHDVTQTKVGRLCIRELPPLTERRRRGWPFVDDDPSGAP